MVLHPWRWLLAVAAIFVLSGCGKGSPTNTVTVSEAKPATSETTTTVPADNGKAKGNTPAAPIPEDSAAAAVLRTLKALEAGDLAQAYEFLPPSYQGDIDGLIHEFAERMDAELWSKLAGTFRKSLEVFRTKKEWILALDLFRNRPDIDTYRKSWDPTVQLLTTFAENDLGDLTKLQKIQSRTLLPGKAAEALNPFDAFGRAIGADLQRQFAGLTVTPVKSEGNEQIVALKGPHDDKPAEIAYVKHDGRWLPKSLVDHWKEGITADRAWLDKLPDRIRTVKPALLERLTNADEILDQLLSAGNREQFEQAAGPAILALATAWPDLQALAKRSMSDQTELPNIRIVINRELTEKELSKLVIAVLKPLRDAGSNYTLLANDGRTICRLSRIGDVKSVKESLAAYFKVAIDDIEWDADTSTLKIDIAP